MSFDEDTAKTGRPQSSSASSLQLSDCTGGYSSVSVMMEGEAVTPDFAAACPVLGTAASPKHTNIESTEQRATTNENSINRRNSFQHSKQQQQTKLTKRRYTASSSFKHPTSGKRRRRANSESDSVLPTNFLLGGNIFDPLNLNSLLDEEVNRALNAETPKSSPLPAKSRDPVEILIPRDITDPLNLNSGIADSNFLVSPYKSGGRKRHRNRHHGGAGGGGGGSGISITQMNLSESGKSEVNTSSSAQLPVMLDSCSALDSSKESDNFSSVTGELHEPTADSSSSCKEEVTSVSVEDSSSALSGGPYQHTSRRKRRRNSGKMEPPVIHSTPISKSGCEVRSFGTGGSRNSFHTPRGGSKTGSGLRQHQQPHSQGKVHQKKFQYGNYNKYYGYRNPGTSEDPRIRVLRREWFEGKDVLDLGCNSGHLTLYIAKNLRPARILGLDIDNSLVHAARKNIRHYLSELQTKEARSVVQGKETTKQEERNGNESHTGTEKKHNDMESGDENGKAGKGQRDPAEAVNDNDSCHTDETSTQRQDSKTEEMEQEDCDAPPADHSVSCTFPVSLRISRGPIAAPLLTEASTVKPGEFPSNVSFIKANYVLESDNLLLTQRPEYDVILCLSVTKWVHLNWGDSGLKRLFKRVYNHLRPGGMFILEPQPWESYVRRKKLTDNINRNFKSIRLKPEQFSSYLTTEVGFTRFEHLGAPKCSARGFQRPIYVYHK
ncbi:7SK snRNA methylphosphate capping enzyme-like [Melanotaenia boesemani]|uniref:7SK snRNA methylphosphate capping enzyme-like n=1 Tax=Melanotaenia boesemani TaxID=1250792 RepID=UPI001C03E303|nr:7SK snRNA methylphosphate capping enzyme-like [Melanotaenia boesemani]XP_041863847.1 7SK snRNA methylphosphate capping enzyme-like [Melanotaenia boesemani]XP_041863848.1 7SK snRNA methylphosphate capping enzyme-like [Melanotaenia boesemani]